MQLVTPSLKLQLVQFLPVSLGIAVNPPHTGPPTHYIHHLWCSGGEGETRAQCFIKNRSTSLTIRHLECLLSKHVGDIIAAP